MKTKTNALTAPDRTADALKLLEEGIQRLTSSEEWTRWLRMQAAFHAYSFSNVQLIMAQRPDATRVAGYKTWEKLGRQVVKGEKAIWILAPRFFKPKTTEAPAIPADSNNEDDEQGKVYFKAVPVFAFEQTDGAPLPLVVRKLDGDDDGGLLDRLMAFSASRDVPVMVEAIAGSANGFYSPADNRIVIREGLAAQQAAKTLAHEIAHSFLHTDIEVYRAHRGDAELEAESVAFVVLHHAGIDAGQYSFAYTATWAGGNVEAIKSLKACAQRIQATARAIIEGVTADPGDMRL